MAKGRAARGCGFRLSHLLVLFLYAFFVSLIPNMADASESAESDSMYYDNIQLSEQNMLSFSSWYPQDPDITIGYETIGFIFTAMPSEGNPGAVEMSRKVFIDFSNNGKHTWETRNGWSFDNYLIYAAPLLDFLKVNFTREELLSGSVTVYLSDVFVTRHRKSPGAEWVKDRKQYTSLEGIRGAANWTERTRADLANHYDAPIRLTLSKSDVKVTAVFTDYEKTGYLSSPASLSLKEEVTLTGESFSAELPEALSIEGKTYTYEGIARGDDEVPYLRDYSKQSLFPVETDAEKMGFYALYRAEKVIEEEDEEEQKPITYPYEIRYVYADEWGSSYLTAPSMQIKKSGALTAGETVCFTADLHASIAGRTYELVGSALTSSDSRPSLNDYMTGSNILTFVKSEVQQYLYVLYREKKTPVNGEQLLNIERYFTTTEGYTLEKLMTNPSYQLAVVVGGSNLSSSMITKRTESYRIGVDDQGNRWYFLPDENHAVAVHPAVYKGISADTNMKAITELTFPETIRYGQKDYIVTAIGGGGSQYHKSDSYGHYSPMGTECLSYDYGAIHGEYWFYRYEGNYGDGYGYTRSRELSAEYLYGVVGTGYILSEDVHLFLQYKNADTIMQNQKVFRNYFVYNTTLQSITIPDTVTTIRRGAFYGCQALKTIHGGDNLTTIEKMAFAGGASTIAKLSIQEQFGNTSYREEFYYNESFSKTQKTDRMRQWENQVALGHQLPFPSVNQWRKLLLVGELSFSYHRNLCDVELATTVLQVDKDAFAYSYLEDIKLKSDETAIYRFSHLTLGARGNGPARTEEDRTKVYANRNSTADSYVSEHKDWYVLIPPNPSITLDGRGATKQEQKEVKGTKGEKLPKVLLPEKDGYDFCGYYTKVRGGGEQYIDNNGVGVRKLPEKDDITILYAKWQQKPVEKPIPVELPDRKPAEELTIPYVVSREDEVTLFSEVYDVEQGIPSTEKVSMRGKLGAWQLVGTLRRRIGSSDVRVEVTIPYRTRIENAIDETVATSERREKTVTIRTRAVWSYYEIESCGVYYANQIRIDNTAFVTSELVDLENSKRVAFSYEQLGGFEKHLRWEHVDRNGIPVITVAETEEFLLISEKPGEEPDVDSFLAVIANNIAAYVEPTVQVRSDSLSVEGITILSGEQRTNHGAALDEKKLDQIEALIPVMSIDRERISLKPLSTNGRKETAASVLRLPDSRNRNGLSNLEGKVEGANPLFVHTPVVCNASLQVNHQGDSQRQQPKDAGEPLILDTNGVTSDFVVHVNNHGYHSEKRGYGERDYAEYLSEADGHPRNEVNFPFDVYVDVGNDLVRDNDLCLEQGTWYRLGTDKQRFYVSGDTKEGSHTIVFRSVAVNGVGLETRTEAYRNVNAENYVAWDEKQVEVIGRLCDFRVTAITNSEQWEKEKVWPFPLTVGIQSSPEAQDTDIWRTLPLRAGVHTKYKNMGALRMGERLSIQLTSIGSSYEKNATMRLTPEFVVLEDGHYTVVDVYREEKTEQGSLLKPLDPLAEQLIWTSENNAKVQGGGICIWNGDYQIKENLHFVRAGTRLLEIEKTKGLSFKEDFFLREKTILLRFRISLQNEEGTVLYYGATKDAAYNATWVKEAGEPYRLDAKGNRYPITGGETAVVSTEGAGATTHGIY